MRAGGPPAAGASPGGTPAASSRPKPPAPPAAPKDVVGAFVRRAIAAFVAQGVPDSLAPGQEPLSLQGFLQMERAVPSGSFEATELLGHKALYDATNEYLLGVYRATNRIRGRAYPGAPPPPPPAPLPSAEELAAGAAKQVAEWRAVKVASEADVDRALQVAVNEQERGWADCGEEEAELKVQVADRLWDELLGDVAMQLSGLDRRLRRRRSGTTTSTTSLAIQGRRSGGDGGGAGSGGGGGGGAGSSGVAGAGAGEGGLATAAERRLPAPGRLAPFSRPRMQ